MILAQVAITGGRCGTKASDPRQREVTLNMQISTDQAISELIQAKSDATRQKVAFAVAAKQLDSQKQMGDALVSLIEQAAVVQKQVSSGHLDVKA